MNVLRRLSLPRLLLLCGLVLVIGSSLTALALALSAGPVPAPKPLPDAIHDALANAHSQPIEGVSAQIQLTNHLLEGANIISGGGEGSQLTSNPLMTGGSGRLWITKDGDVRLELQSEEGDTEVLYNGHTITLYDGGENTVYRYTMPPQKSESSAPTDGYHHEVPTVAKIEEALTKLSRHAIVSAATPTDVAGQPAYTVRISPKEHGGLIGGAALSFDAESAVPLRAAIYSSSSESPVIELAATSISFEPVPASAFEISPPQGAKVKEITSEHEGGSGKSGTENTTHPKLSVHGQGLEAIRVIESTDRQGQGKPSTSLPEDLQKVQINGVSAAELPTQLGTLLSYERAGVRYLLFGAVTPSAIEAFARGL